MIVLTRKLQMATLLELMAKVAKTQAPKVQAPKAARRESAARMADDDDDESAAARRMRRYDREVPEGFSTRSSTLSNGSYLLGRTGPEIRSGVWNLLGQPYDKIRDVGLIKHPEAVGMRNADSVHIVIGRKSLSLGSRADAKAHVYSYDVLGFDDEDEMYEILQASLSLADATKIADYFYHVGNHHAMRHNDPKIQEILNR